jgi:hypothetical protein
MSEKKWSVKWRDHSFRGKHGKKGGSQFPRHAMNLYEGTHLGMKKKIWSRSGRCNSGWKYSGAWLRPKYIVGLLNKYVGKPYEDFKQIYDNKIKQFKKYDLSWSDLKDYIHDEPKDCYWKQEFYIDEDGKIQRCKLRARYNIWGPRLTKKQKRFNERVQIPNFGICRDDAHYPVTKSYWGNYEDESSVYLMHAHKKMGALLLGTFYVIVNRRVLRLPVYTCNSKYHREYYCHRESEYDRSLGKYVTIPYENYLSYSERNDASILRKHKEIVNDWIPVHSDLGPKMRGQDAWIVMDNPKVNDVLKYIKDYEKLIEDNPDSENVKNWKAALERNKEELEKLPSKEHYNMGYGKFYLFVKRYDYEREIERMVSQSESR